jgi:cytochrome oxidase Cu insertion factor (SCO1/SenC/PrrC family)
MRRLAVFAALVAVAIATAATTATARPVALGDIALVDQSGTAFRLRELAGRPAAIAFIATRCRDTCPMVNAAFSEVARRSPRARLVTISLDPGYDTPFVMARYARELQARTPRWRFVTGHPADVASVLAAFGVVVERGADGIPDAHSDFIYVLDRGGKLETTLPLSTHTVADLRTALVL